MKKLKGTARIITYAGVAKPNPKMGQALGPLGLNMMQFCKEFNERTSEYRNDLPVRIILKAYTDRSYEFLVKPPPTSWYLKRCAMKEKGDQNAKREFPLRVGIKYIYEIAKVKKAMDPHLKNHEIRGICKMILAQAHAMGVGIDRESDIVEPIITKKI